MKKTSKIISLIFLFLLLVILTSCGDNYEVVFKDYDGTVLKTETISKGSDATPPLSPNNKEGYHFVSWDKSVEKIEKDTTITAVYEINKYKITFLNGDEVLQEELVEYGELPNYEGIEPFKDNLLKFSGWSPELKTATKDQIYTAVFENKYILATDEDFLGDKYGEFVYIGDAEYVIIPEYIKGVKVTKTSDFLKGIDESDYVYLFMDRKNIKGVIFENPKNITNMTMLFHLNNSETLELDYLDTSNVTNMTFMFDSSRATILDLSNFNTKNVTKMNGMFADSEVIELDLSSFDTSNVTDMSYMFYDSKAITLDLNNFDTSKVTDMYAMFYSSAATKINLSSFDTSNVTDMNYMFSKSQATTIDLSSFDTSNVTEMNYMFSKSQATTIDLSSFDTSNVASMYQMFRDSNVTILDLSSFDTSNVTNMLGMFYNSKAVTLDLSNFDTSNVEDSDMSFIFDKSKATLGYARNRKEAARFNYQKDIFVYDEKEGIDYIFFGTYPQTVVDDEVLIDKLNKLTETNSNGYYEYEGNEYQRLIANPYNPTYKFNNGKTIVSDKIYYFKVEPIKWLILEEEDGTLTLLADMILDHQQFYTSRDNREIDDKTIYPNNYEYSAIIEWLNNDFYNKAFNNIDKEQILKTFVDNSASTTTSSSNEYVSENTYDWVYLLSYQELKSVYFSINEERIAKPSDYTKAINIYVSEDYGSDWWLRSPNSSRSNYAHKIKVDGSITGSYVFNNNIGVRPALKIKINQ